MTILARYITHLIAVIATLLLPACAESQEKVTHQQQVWIGYMTSSKISEKYSLWNDAHFVPGSFAILRTGITRIVCNNGGLTAGYAILALSTTSNEKLRRTEHRPWAQLQFSFPVSASWSLTQRVRYDARFRKNIVDGQLEDGFGFNHRVRFLFSLKKSFGEVGSNKTTPYIVLSNETLLNFGRPITYNTFDQNRISISAGLQKKQTQYQLGLMNRFVQTAPSRYTLNHTVVFWVIQKFDLQRHKGKTERTSTKKKFT
jgi:hypothetical protein